MPTPYSNLYNIVLNFISHLMPLCFMFQSIHCLPDIFINYKICAVREGAHQSGLGPLAVSDLLRGCTPAGLAPTHWGSGLSRQLDISLAVHGRHSPGPLAPYRPPAAEAGAAPVTTATLASHEPDF